MRYFACTVVVEAESCEDARNKLDGVIRPTVFSPYRPQLMVDILTGDTEYDIGYKESTSEEPIASYTVLPDKKETITSCLLFQPKCSVGSEFTEIYFRKARLHNKDPWILLCKYKPETLTKMYVNSVSAV